MIFIFTLNQFEPRTHTHTHTHIYIYFSVHIVTIVTDLS